MDAQIGGINDVFATRRSSPQIVRMSGTPPPLRPMEPVFVGELFPPLHAELIGLLRGLDDDAWNRPTLCPRWTVRDIAGHLLDDDLRRLSSHRDSQPLPPASPEPAGAGLVELINRLNAEWVAVARRFSPRVIVDLLAFTGPQIAALFTAVDPFGPAHFAVSWAGEERSENWFDIGRDYTERWLHQQQIRVAVGAPGLLQRRWLHPVLALFVRSLPHAYRAVPGKDGSSVVLEVLGDASGAWTLLRAEGRWRLYDGALPSSTAQVGMTADTAWRLFSKALKTDADRAQVAIAGDRALGAVVLGARAIIA
jgi:uncharacterized protein (TIGR03083 family)